MACFHVMWFIFFISASHGARIYLLKSPLLYSNNSMGSQNVSPRIFNYPRYCLDALDAIYGYQDGENITTSLTEFCTNDDCLKPQEYYWKELVHDIAMSAYMTTTLCQTTSRGYCTQQFIYSTSGDERLTDDVDEECITNWCPLVCKPYKEKHDEYMKCCSNVLVGQQKTFLQTSKADLYGLTPKSLHVAVRQYDYCGQLLMRFQSDSKCLNIIELIAFIIKLVHNEDDMFNIKANRDILAKALESYCESDCIQIISSYYTACAGVDEAIHQLFLFKALYCAKNGNDYCIVKGLEKMDAGEVSKFKLRIYCVAPELKCPRKSCKDAINAAKSALGCCCQNLFNIEGSPFRDLIPEFIMRFMECQIDVPKMCGCSTLTTSLLAIVVMAALVATANKFILV